MVIVSSVVILMLLYNPLIFLLVFIINMFTCILTDKLILLCIYVLIALNLKCKNRNVIFTNDIGVCNSDLQKFEENKYNNDN